MKKYTIEQLEAMKLDKIKGIAKNEFKLALSEKGKRFTKGQLIIKIVAMITNEEIEQEEKTRKRKFYTGSGTSGSGITKTHDLHIFNDSALPSIKNKLDLSNTHTIVAQARKILKEEKYTSDITQDNRRVIATIKHVQESILSLRMQVAKGELKGMKRKQANNAISLMSIMVNSYKKKVGVKN